ncbi:MAG: hypothetical protein AB8H03_08505 [Saprospiraceae bacterium]
MEKSNQENLDQLLKLIDSKNAEIRDATALKLKDLKNDRAIEPLLNSIFRNRNFNGTMVYALGSLNCEEHLVNIFRILFYEGYEAKLGAYSILSEQSFKFSQDELLNIQKMWKECIANPTKYEGFSNKEIIMMMEDAYIGFMEYLEK